MELNTIKPVEPMSSHKLTFTKFSPASVIALQLNDILTVELAAVNTPFDSHVPFENQVAFAGLCSVTD